MTVTEFLGNIYFNKIFHINFKRVFNFGKLFLPLKNIGLPLKNIGTTPEEYGYYPWRIWVLPLKNIGTTPEEYRYYP